MPGSSCLPSLRGIFVNQAWVVVTALASVVMAAPVRASSEITAPPPRMIELIRRQMAHEGRWSVTTSQSRLEWNEAEVGADGLRGLLPQRGGGLAPGLVSWSDIQRIDEHRTAFRRGQGLGLALGALAGGFGGAAIEAEATGSDMGGITWAGVGVGAIAGTLLGGWMGDRVQLSDRTIYVAAPERAPSPEPPPTIASVADGAAKAKVRPGELIRLKGAFGDFVGRASAIDADGISGLKPASGRDSGLPLPPQPISWSDMTRVERRDNCGTTGALLGVLALGGIGGALGAEMSGSNFMGGGIGGSGAGFGLGFLAGAIPGVLVGGLIGSTIPRWQVVLDHPASSSAGNPAR